ncbi:MAG: Twin-arginine translocation protein TatB [uncultured Propionibacteriaceae bacterium]|uniref:Twin-arginine translocation protein TatB n=1 Tax=uncultured Propionibacteriaceae bacterium TaxID=257457 RepID=A0A6J4MZ56_9ACTN|nr:MAG: Twin-arginine translocation protein TatB [uncultured Propionibacteriaceae bacterium]
MFDIGAPEFLLLIVAAVILFGPEKLPEFARKAARVLRYVRTMAGSAQEQLSKELGEGFEDIDLRDLNPKTFVQKHLLDNVDPIVADVKKDFAEATAGGAGASKAVAEALDSAKDISRPKDVSSGGPHDVMAANSAARVLTPFDSDAT